MKTSAAEILHEYGPFPGADRVNGVTYDGQHVWFAAGDTLEMPRGTGVSGLESDGGDRFYCGGESSGKVRAVRRPRRGAA